MGKEGLGNVVAIVEVVMLIVFIWGTIAPV